MKKIHPHDDDSILMISYKNETPKEEIIRDIINMLKLNVEIYENIKSNMLKV